MKIAAAALLGMLEEETDRGRNCGFALNVAVLTKAKLSLKIGLFSLFVKYYSLE